MMNSDKIMSLQNSSFQNQSLNTLSNEDLIGNRKIFTLNYNYTNILDLVKKLKNTFELDQYQLEYNEFCLTTNKNYSTEETNIYQKIPLESYPYPKYILFYFHTDSNEFEGGEFKFKNGQTIKPTKGTVIFFKSEDEFKINEIKDGDCLSTIIKYY